jgi:hypothetical protein
MLTALRSGDDANLTAQTVSCAQLMAIWHMHIVRLVLNALASCGGRAHA